MAAIWQQSATELNASYAARELVPSAVLDAVLDRYAEVNPKLNAFAYLDREGAAAMAAASDARWRAGQPLGPLDGVPINVKDNITVKGLPCSWGTWVFDGYVPDADEVPVERIREAGAVILGKSTCSEFSTGRGIVSTPKYGTTRNPWRLDVTPGSSSAGAVASVASGIGPVAIGTDGGGSVRTPCSHCGLVGLKPSSGRVARARGLPIILGGREVVGPIARTVADLAAVFAVIARPHPLDGLSWAFSDAPPAVVGKLRPQRVLYMPRVGDNPVVPEIAEACAAAAANLAAMGHKVEEGAPTFDIESAARSANVVTQSGLSWLLRDKDWRGKVTPYYATQYESGAALTAADYVNATSELRRLQGEIGAFFETYDLILSPVTGSPAWSAEESPAANFNVFTNFVNAGGVPGISIPAAISSDGRPFGIQIVGRFGADWDLVELAREYEARHPWAHRWPPI